MKNRYTKFYVFIFLFFASLVSFVLSLEKSAESDNTYFVWFTASFAGVIIFCILSVIFLIIGVVNTQGDIKAERNEQINGNHISSNSCYCPNCGKENSIDNDFCVACGTELVKTSMEMPVYEIHQNTQTKISKRMAQIMYIAYPLYIFLFLLNFIVGFLVSFCAFRSLDIMYTCLIGLGYALLFFIINFTFECVFQNKQLKNTISTDIKIYENYIYASVDLKEIKANQCTKYRVSYANVAKAKEHKDTLYIFYQDGKKSKMILIEKNDEIQGYNFLKKKLENKLKQKGRKQ